MRTRSAAIPLEMLAAIGNGFMVAQYLRGCGINPEGKIKRMQYGDCMVYIEDLEGEDERSDKVGAVSTMEGGI